MDKLDLSSCIIQETEEEKNPIQLVINQNALENINVRVSIEQKKALEALAKKYKLTMSEVVRQLIEQGIELVNRK